MEVDTEDFNYLPDGVKFASFGALRQADTNSYFSRAMQTFEKAILETDEEQLFQVFTLMKELCSDASLRELVSGAPADGLVAGAAAEQKIKSLQLLLDQKTSKCNELEALLIRFEEQVQAQAKEIEVKDLTIKDQEKTILERVNRMHQLNTQLEETQRVLEMSAKLNEKQHEQIKRVLENSESQHEGMKQTKALIADTHRQLEVGTQRQHVR